MKPPVSSAEHMGWAASCVFRGGCTSVGRMTTHLRSRPTREPKRDYFISMENRPSKVSEPGRDIPSPTGKRHREEPEHQRRDWERSGRERKDDRSKSSRHSCIRDTYGKMAHPIAPMPWSENSTTFRRKGTETLGSLLPPSLRTLRT